MTVHTVGPTGVEVVETWRTVSGATDVEVDSASLVVDGPAAGASRDLGTISGPASDVDQLILTIPGGERTVRTLRFNGFTRPVGDGYRAIRERADLDDGLAVALVDASGAVGSPVHTVPAVPRDHAVPPLLGGASFSNRTLRLPGLRASKLHVTRVRNSRPDEFETQDFSVSSVSATIAPHPEDLRLEGPDGATLFEHPGAFGATGRPATVDLRVPLELALADAVVQGRALRAAFTLSAGVEGEVRMSGIASSGDVVRRFAEPVVVALEGVPVPLPLGGPPLDGRRPRSVGADLTISYDGLRLHPLSDPIPTGAGGLSGPVVGSDPVLRPLPRGALAGERLARIGVVGRTVGATDLSARVVRVVGDGIGEPVGDPGVVALDADDGDGTDRPAVVWVDLPEPLDVEPPVGVTLTATRGGFRWAADPEPALLLAVVDLEPGGTPVSIGGSTVAVHETRDTTVGMALSPASFQAGPPMVSSALFVTVQLDRLTLRYAP